MLIARGIAAVAGATLAAGAGAAPADESACRSGITSSASHVLFVESVHGGRTLYACERATGTVQELSSAHLPGTPQLRGRVAAWAAFYCRDVDSGDGGGDDCSTIVQARDLMSGEERSADAGPRYAKVGSVRVTRELRLAWIACPVRSPVDGLRYRRGPECLRPGRRRNVVYVLTGDEPRRLDRGRGIAPTSLRLDGSRLSWLKGSTRRHGRL